MATKSLLEPILEDGIKNLHYFEGRLLSAKDLREQQEANRRHHRQLGSLAGYGIVEGLGVSIENKGGSGASPVVRVAGGKAVNLLGEAVELPLDYIDVELSRILEPVDPVTAIFRDCDVEISESLAPSAAGLYLLVMSPASQNEGYALKSGLQDRGVAHQCGRAYVAEGVQFRLVRFDAASMPGLDDSVRTALNNELLSDSAPVTAADPDKLSLMRNLAAHICLGTEDAYNTADAPNLVFDPAPGIGLDALLGVDEGLARCDTPLALIYWTFDGIGFVDNWVVRRMMRYATPGILRITQFSHQLDWLLKLLNGAATATIDQYFRFIPPAAYLRYRFVSTLSGYRPTELFAGLYRGISDRTDRGQLNRLLRDSLDFPSLDLEREQFFQLFTSLDLDDPPSEFPTRPHFFYLARNLFRLSVDDDIARVVANTWTVYNGLLRRQVFLPPATDADKITARLTIEQALGEVIAMANRYSAIAATSGLDTRGVLRLFNDLYAVQEHMVELFGEDIPGINDTQERELFASTIEHILKVNTPPDNAPSYRQALQDASINGALDAQIEINRFVGSWSGEGVAIGPFGFSYEGSPEGAVLVPGADATPHLFTLKNGTNKSLEFNLVSNVFADSGDWSNSSTILRAINGGEINSIRVNNGNSTGIVVMIEAPLDALEKESITIKLTAEVGPPTSRSNTYERSDLFVVGDTPGGPVTGTADIISYDFSSPVGDVDETNLSPDSFIFLSAVVSHEIADVAVADFAMDILLETADHNAWQFMDANGNNALDEDPENVFTINLPGLTGGGIENPRDICSIVSPARDPSSDLSISFRLRVRSVGLDEEVSDIHDDLITLTVQHS